MKNHSKENSTSPDVMAARAEAARCLLCHDAPCSAACPAGTDPGKFIRSIRFENYKGAAETIRENNILGGICARVCPYQKYCQGACLQSGIDRPIQIGMLQQFAADYERAANLHVLERGEDNGHRVAIVGSGPAGLAAAAKLAQLGCGVTVFERDDRPGGWLSYGIPEERLPQDVVDHEVGCVKDLGVEIVTGTEIGRDITLPELMQQGYEAVLIAAGLHRCGELDIEGTCCDNVVTAGVFLAQAKDGEARVGKQVVVIGGGDVAADCALAAKALGAQDVKILYRRTIDKMPANKEERDMLHEAQIPIFTGFKPAEIIEKDGIATAIRGTGMFDDSTIELPADNIIIAIGQLPGDMKEIADVALKDDGFIVVSDYATDKKGIFACGDITEGDKTVVYAVKAGKDAAVQIHAYLNKSAETRKGAK